VNPTEALEAAPTAALVLVLVSLASLVWPRAAVSTVLETMDGVARLRDSEIV